MQYDKNSEAEIRKASDKSTSNCLERLLNEIDIEKSLPKLDKFNFIAIIEMSQFINSVID
jgi:hypothetical protein